MKWTLATACMILIATVTTVNGLRTLSYPVFSVGKTYVYDASINLTARIPGLHSQVSKRALTMKVKIRAEKGDSFSLKIDDVLGSGSLSSVSSDTVAVNLKQNAALESRLKLPIRFFYQDGEVKNYTLDSKESLESQKIKRTILRNLELYIDSEALGKDIDEFPLLYSIRKPTQFQTPSGNYSSHYTIISSPYFTNNDQITVFNISRVDNYESISYDAYETFTNFMAQGCSKVCRKDDKQGEFDSRCPLGYESYERPIQKSFVQNHNLQSDEEEVLLDSVETKETHVANLYDQSMEIAIKSSLRFKEVNLEKIQPPKFQTERTDLNKYSDEINEKEIAKLCGGVNEAQAVAAAKTFLREVSTIVVADNLDNSNSSQVGEKLVLLRNALTVLSEEGLRHVQEDIVPSHKLIAANVTESVKRQIWIDMLPVIGTQDSVTFITNIIQENMNVLKKSMSIYEASSILNSLPGNIKQANDQMIRQLSKLLDLISDHKQSGYSYFFSASHIALARTVNKLCSQRKDNIGEESEPKTKDNRSNSVNDLLNENGIFSRSICKSVNVQEFFLHIAKQLESSKELTKTIIYIETIARTGIFEALNSLRPFVMGKTSETSPSKAEYLRVASIKALHSMVDRYPKELQDLVKPIYFNQSESFKVRIPAFSVLIRTKPSLGLLQQVAETTWRELSLEVGSYVTSALETFGNSTLPCGQLLAQRIKKIFPQIKRFGGDYHRSKSLMWSLFDDFRNFGFAKFFQFSANSDSLFPNTLYGAVEYNVDSFRDFILQYSAQIEGVSGSKFYDSILKALKLDPNEPIPESVVQDIFKQVNLTNKEQEPWRLSLYHKMFYSISFNHIEGQDTNFSELAKSTFVHLSPYFKPIGDRRLLGTFVKVHMPSFYQSKAVGQTYPSRVQFQMENPFLTSVKFNLSVDIQNHSNVILSFQPSTYSSVIYTNQILSLGDCQNIGVYHQSNAAMSFSVDLNLTVIDKDITFSYGFTQVPKTVFKYNSGAGTYTGKTKVTSLSMNENRAPIKTTSVPNQREKKFKMIGSPPFVSKIVSEDIFEHKEKEPKGIKQTLNYIIRKFRNCGWRNKTIEVKRVPEEGYWISDTKVTFQTKVGRIIRNLVSYQQTPLDVLIKVLEMDQTSPTDTVKTYTQEALVLYNALDENFCHAEDSWHFNVSKTGMQTNSSDSFWFSIKSIRKSSLTRGLYHVHSDFETKFFGISNTSKGGVDLISTFTGFSNPFSYDDTSYGQQKTVMYFTVNFDKGEPFENTDWFAKASLGYESPTVFNNNKSLAIPDPLYLMPETHSECLKDRREGKAFSLACLKAFRERTMYNKLNWFKILSRKTPNIKVLTDYIDQFKFLEKDSILFRKHLLLDEFFQTAEKISASGRYIDKLYGRPVYEINVKKSNKSANYLFPVNFLTLPILSMEDRIDTYLMKATNNSYPATCVWMDKYLLTYDLETYSLPDVSQNCSFVMSAHCVKDKMFAVVVKTDFESDSSKEVTVYLGANTIAFRKASRWFRVAFNGREHRLSPHNTTSLMGGNVAIAYLIEEGDINVLEVTVFGAGLKFWYDGVRVLLKVSPRYKGELCGMCGQFDGEKHSEFRGLDGKLYRDTNQDFLETFTLGKCFKKELNPVKGYMSPEDPNVSSEEETEAEDNAAGSSDYGNAEEETTTLRNIVLSRNDQFCFSLLPFLTCASEPSEVEEEEVEFKCFLKSDPLTRNWVKEAKLRILMEMNHQECDFIEMVSIPKKC